MTKIGNLLLVRRLMTYKREQVQTKEENQDTHDH